MTTNVVAHRVPKQVEPASGDCLLVIDIQNDFLPGGTLAVPDGEQVIPPLNEYIATFVAASLPIIASRDWHPANHCSFRVSRWTLAGTLRGRHDGSRVCRRACPAAAMFPLFPRRRRQTANRTPTSTERPWPTVYAHPSVKRIFVGGLATEYCVLTTVEDALRLGFQVVLLIDAIRPINVNPTDGIRALERMVRSGAIPALWRTWPDGIRRITVAD